MRWFSRLPFLVILCALAALSMFLPAAHATILADHSVARGFFYSALAILMMTTMVAIASAAPRVLSAPNSVGRAPIGARSPIVAMIAGYAALPFLLAIPLVQMRLPIQFPAAWFDMVSAFTTTGAAPGYPEALPPTITLWRGLVGWMGGLYILVMASAVLLPMGLGGAEIVSAKTTGPSQGRHITASKTIAERVLGTAATIFPIYGALTLVIWIALTSAGESSFSALITAMGVISTSGIAAEAGAVVQNSGFVGEVILVLGLTVALSRHLLPQGAQMGAQMAQQKRHSFQGAQRQAQFYDPELRLGLAIVLATSAALFVYHWIGRTPQTDATMLRAIWGGMVLALSFLTTTGFETQSTQVAMNWAGLQSPGMLLMGLAIMGGGAATTAGGVKLLRIYALMRHGERELERLVHPHSLGGAGQDARFIRRTGALNAWVLFMLFAVTIGVGAALMSLTGLGFDASVTFTIAALTNTGPLATSLPDLPLSYASLSGLQMVVLGVLMVAGRLELLVLAAVLSPSTWRF